MSGWFALSRRDAVLIGCGALFGVVCFVAGRCLVPAGGPGMVSDKSDSSTQLAKNVAEPSNKVPTASPVDSELPTDHSRPLSGWNEKRWQETRSRAGSPARKATLKEMLEDLARVDPDHAMSLARAEGNLRLRESLVQAALQGWARTSPTNAANWALALPDSSEREQALATVFAGLVAASPEQAALFGKSLIEKNPDQAASFGSDLIEALCRAGNFETAAHMAAEGDPAVRAGWLAGAYSHWAEFQPEEAARAASAIKDAEVRNQALHGIVGGWSAADPAALVQFVTQLPPDNERGSLLSQSLERWAKLDPEAASNWINNREAGPELDQGVAAVATMDFVKPDLAVEWAESVVNPKLRSETLVTVVRNWLTTDLPAARHYFETTKNLLPEDRQELTEVFAVFKNDAPRP
jgi:hypothetical protein